MNIGDVFGCWTVVEVPDGAHVIAQCICGTRVKQKNTALTTGHSRMCRSCANRVSKKKHGAHGGTNSTKGEHTSWRHMIGRCHDPSNKDYVKYGAKGIFVFEPWRESFESFIVYMGRKPTPDHTIDRINSLGNYVPGNVRWATRTEQNQNMTTNVKAEIDGETKIISLWLLTDRFRDLKPNAVYKRLARGWTPREALGVDKRTKNAAK